MTKAWEAGFQQKSIAYFPNISTGRAALGKAGPAACSSTLSAVQVESKSRVNPLRETAARSLLGEH